MNKREHNYAENRENECFKFIRKSKECWGIRLDRFITFKLTKESTHKEK